LVILVAAANQAHALSDRRCVDFVTALFSRRDRLESFVHPDELAMSGRLGIRYEGVDHKFLISYDLDPGFRATVDAERVVWRIEPLDRAHNVSRLVLTMPGARDSLAYLFEDSLLISPLRYHSRGWDRIESDHFRFIVSDSASLRDYHIATLERFFDQAATRLKLSEDDRAQIAAGKLNYYLCATEEEVQSLSGFTTMGIYNLAYDAIITSYHAHYHELVHMLVNVKLRTLPLYTHSFLQEGLAVALGGRGSKEPGPILELGRFLSASGVVDYHELFSDSTWDAVDPSMSYPTSGLYNGFLLETMGPDGYLNLYRRHCGGVTDASVLRISESELPPDSSWLVFLETVSEHADVKIGCGNNSGAILLDLPHATITQSDDRYCFSIRDTLLMLPDSTWRDFKSRQYVQLFGDRPYGGEKYVVVADPQEFSVYNLYTGNLIAKWVRAFLVTPVVSMPIDNRYSFSVNRYVFEEDL
jgi:hypothetical protein